MSRRQARLIFPTLVLIAIAATLIYTLRVQAQTSNQMGLDERQAWATTAKIPSSAQVLRPAWLPPSFRHHLQIGTDVWLDGGVDGGYVVSYCAANCFSTQRTELDFALNPQPSHRKPDGVFPFRVRGTTGRFSDYLSDAAHEISWREAGQRYAVFGNKVSPAVLVKVVDSLHQITRTR